MSFPDSPRIIYRRNPLAEVEAKLLFPAILKIDSEPPAVFHDAIRTEYPRYTDVPAIPPLPPNLPPQIASIVQGFNPGRMGGVRHRFISQDEKWQVTLTRGSLELKTMNYTRWEEFRERIMRLCDTIRTSYRPPDAYSRIELRYVDVIRRSSLGLTGVRWSELLKPYIAGELSVPELADGVNTITHQLHCKLDGTDIFLTLKTGIAETPAPEKEQCFLIDSNFHTHQQMEVNNVLNTLNEFNRTSGQFFRWCIELRLHNAMEPQPIAPD